MKQDNKSVSRFLSLVLRHKPEEIGLTLDSEGWANVDELLRKAKINRDKLHKVVKENDKQRFAFNEDQTLIRASQGHSIDINLDLKEMIPPNTLYHGTPLRNAHVILTTGLKKMSRHHVHLSADEETANVVGSRRGKHLVVVIDAASMYNDGYKFYRSANGVWLTDNVPPEGKYFYIKTINLVRKEDDMT